MSFQDYETLLEKTDENISYIVDYIAPALKNDELSTFMADERGKGYRKSKFMKDGTVKGFVTIDNEGDSLVNISKLNSKQLELLYQAFISKELNDKVHVKWRFYQFLKYTDQIKLKSVQINLAKKEEKDIDFILETIDGEIMLVTCFSVLDMDNYMELINNFIDFALVNNIYPDKVIIAPNKTYRNIPIAEHFTIEDKSVTPELWVEWEELNKPFNGDDLLIVNNIDELTLAGFNFGGMQSLLSFVFRHSQGGQISIFKQIGFFSEEVHDTEQVELIWKGIMIKQN